MRIPQGLRSALASQTSAPPSTPTTDEYFGDVSLLLYGDGTNGSTAIVDSSSNGHAITVNGDAQISTTQSKFGGSSLYFDGTGDGITAPSDPSFDFGTGDFTIEFWMRPSNASGTWQVLVTRKYGATGGWRLYKTSGSTELSFYHPSGNYVTSGAGLTNGTWYHIAVVRNGSTLTTYVDGTSRGTDTISAAMSPTSADLEIGQGVYSFPLPYEGYLDDLRITKGVARYTSNFTPPTASFSTVTPGEKYFYQNSLLLSADGSNGSTAIVDSSANAHAITVNGNAQISTTQSKFGGSSMYFDGTGDYLATPVSDTLSLGTSDFTIECWAWRSANAPANSVLLQMSNSADVYSALFGFAASGNFLVYLSSAGSSWDIASGQVLGSIDNETWVHYALTREGSTFRTFKNGVQQSIWTSSASIYQASNQVRIGAGQPYAACNYGGYIDDLRITKGVARYTSDFTIPTSEASSSDPYFSSTKLLLNGNGTNGSTDFVDSTGNFGKFYVNYGTRLAVNGEIPNGGTAYWVDIVPSNAVVNYHNLNFDRVHFSDVNQGVYWVGSGYNVGNVTQARFDLRDFPTVTSVRIYAAGISGYNPYEARLLDSNKNVISNTTVTFNNSSFQWVTVPVAGSPAFIEFYTSSTNPRFYLNAIEVNGQHLVSKPITANGNAQISTAQSKFGSASMYFDGSGDYLTVSNATASDVFGTGDFTWEAWINPSTIPSSSSNTDIFGIYDTPGAPGIIVGLNGSNIRFYVEGTLFYSSGTALSTNTWYHVAVTRQGIIGTIFINGEPSGVGTLYNAPTSNNFSIGRPGSYVGNYFHGYIDDFRITKGVARYGNFAVPTAGFSTLTPVEPYFHNNSLLLHGDGTNGSTSIVDDSINNHTITANGNAQISTTQSKFGGSSLFLDGTGDYLLINSQMSTFEFPGDFTIEGWFWFNQSNVGYQGLLGSAVNGDMTGFVLITETTNHALHFYGSSNTSWNTVLATSTVPSTNTWHHIAVCRSGSTVTMYLNGTSIGSTTSSNFIRSGSSLRVGGYQYFPGGERSFNGYIDELRITKGVARYTANFTPPTSAFPDL